LIDVYREVLGIDCENVSRDVRMLAPNLELEKAYILPVTRRGNSFVAGDLSSQAAGNIKQVGWRSLTCIVTYRLSLCVGDIVLDLCEFEKPLWV
jgi:hypothetical protein